MPARIMTILNDFKTFILKGNVVDLAVGVVIGAGFKNVVDSVVADIITPLIGAVGGQPNFSAVRLGPLAVGNFINVGIAFLILAAVVFFLVIKPMNVLLAMAKKKAGAQPAAPVPVPDDVQLLREIRDLLKSRPI